jgi:lipopolysaccharide export system protein LptC
MIDTSRIKKRLDVKYARYLKLKRADRFVSPDEISYAEKHSERVNYLKKFIFRMVILLIILLIVWPMANRDWSGSKINFSNEEADQKNTEEKAKDQNLPVMLKPNFFGNDDNGQPFNITAVSGVNVSENKVVLTDIAAQMNLKDNSKIKLVSSRGDYASKQRRLILNGGVIITTDSGYEFKTSSAYVETKENMATGSELVNISGRLGEIDAQGFTIRNSGDEILLFGGVDLNADIDDKAGK